MIPQPKFIQIYDELNSIGKFIDRKPYIFKLNAFKKDAKNMINNFPVEANIILGAISSLEDNINEMHKFHKIALNYSNNSRLANYQYAISLMNTNFLNAAYDFFLKAYNIESSDSDIVNTSLIIEHLMSVCYYLHKDTEYEGYKRMLDKLDVEFFDPDQFVEDDEKILDQMFSMVDANIEQNPFFVTKPDPNLMKEIEDLIDGVELT